MSRTLALGCFARYQTLYSQQIRAINLIVALERTGQLSRDDRVIVIGGGIAGMTSAVAARRRGARNVTLVEESDQLIPFQRESKGRYLHPRTYDWPFIGSDDKTALPFMNWKGGDSHEVFGALDTEFNELCDQLGDIKVIHNKRLESVTDQEGEDPVLVTLENAHGQDGEAKADESKDLKGDTLILAIGFGREFRRQDIPGYWDGDGLQSIEPQGISCLVSGYGDGALTDLIRLLVKRFDHDELVSRIIENDNLKKSLRENLLGGLGIREAFEAVPQVLRNDLRDSLRLRGDTEVSFCAPKNAYLESQESCLLNRFLVHLLEPHIKFLPGRLKEIPDPPVGNDNRYKVEFEAKGDQELLCGENSYDRIVPRHGVDSETDTGGEPIPKVWAASRTLAEIWDRCREQRLNWRREPKFDDRTRVPNFQPEDLRQVRVPPGSLSNERPQHGLRVLMVSSSLKVPGGARPLAELVPDALKAHNRKLKRPLSTGKNDPEFETLEVRTNAEGLSSGWFEHVVRQICRADVAFFDITGYQPLVMTLLGIRSIVRRGINICCTYEEIDSAYWSNLPFNIKELFPLSIGPTVDDPSGQIGTMLLDALSKLRALPAYQDLPGFDAIRRAARSNRFQNEIPWEGQDKEILWLCSFDEKYTTQNNEKTVRDKIRSEFGHDMPVKRITEIVSPELTSQKLFDAIRRYRLCVIDWTQWSSNLFFEFGVRLAANPLGPVCLISASPLPAWAPKGGDDDPDAKECYEKQDEQVKWLKRAFAAIEYRVPDRERNEEGREHDQLDAAEVLCRAEAMRDAESAGSPRIKPTYGFFRYDFAYSLIAEEIEEEEELPKRNPQRTLQDNAAQLVGELSARRTDIPAIYTEKNKQLNTEVRRAALDYLVASWRYVIGEVKLLGKPAKEEVAEARGLAFKIREILEYWDIDKERKEGLYKELEREKAFYNEH